MRAPLGLLLRAAEVLPARGRTVAVVLGEAVARGCQARPRNSLGGRPLDRVAGRTSAAVPNTKCGGHHTAGAVLRCRCFRSALLLSDRKEGAGLGAGRGGVGAADLEVRWADSYQTFKPGDLCSWLTHFLSTLADTVRSPARRAADKHPRNRSGFGVAKAVTCRESFKKGFADLVPSF